MKKNPTKTLNFYSFNLTYPFILLSPIFFLIFIALSVHHIYRNVHSCFLFLKCTPFFISHHFSTVNVLYFLPPPHLSGILLLSLFPSLTFLSDALVCTIINERVPQMSFNPFQHPVLLQRDQFQLSLSQ